MSTQMAKAIDVASKVTSLAEDGLHALDVTIAGWPAEFRAIVWSAVAEIALQREAALKTASREGE